MTTTFATFANGTHTPSKPVTLREGKGRWGVWCPRRGYFPLPRQGGEVTLPRGGFLVWKRKSTSGTRIWVLAWGLDGLTQPVRRDWLDKDGVVSATWTALGWEATPEGGAIPLPRQNLGDAPMTPPPPSTTDVPIPPPVPPRKRR